MRFKETSHVHNIEVQGEAANAGTEAVASYPEDPAEIINEGGYLKQQLFNVDQIALHWKKVPFRTFIAGEEMSLPGFKASKDRLVLLLRADVAGDFRLESVLIYHSLNPSVTVSSRKSECTPGWPLGRGRPCGDCRENAGVLQSRGAPLQPAALDVQAQCPGRWAEGSSSSRRPDGGSCSPHFPLL